MSFTITNDIKKIAFHCLRHLRSLFILFIFFLKLLFTYFTVHLQYVILNQRVTGYIIAADQNNEPRYEKTGFFHMRKQRPRSVTAQLISAFVFSADQRLYVRYTDSTIPQLPKSEISSL